MYVVPKLIPKVLFQIVMPRFPFYKNFILSQRRGSNPRIVGLRPTVLTTSPL